MELIIDGHLDLSMNALEWNRDLRWETSQIRESEAGMTDKPDRGRGTVSFPAMRRGNIGICVATQIARYVKPGSKLPGWHSPEQAWAMTRAQLAWYRTMEEAGEMVQIICKTGLAEQLDRLEARPGQAPLGYILSLEGADSIVSLSYLEKAWNDGLRAIGPAHYGPGTYAQGTDAAGPLPEKGRDLLKEMDRLGCILDATHLNDACFWQAMDLFKGPVWASHHNCRVFVNHNRQFTDAQILEVIRRNGVIGTALDAWMLVPGWVRGISTPQSMQVSLQQAADNIDHICQLAGNARHAAIGSDLDGAFGTEQCPVEIDTIADLHKLAPLLAKRGYSESDIRGVLSGNWIRFLQEYLPD